MLALCLDVHHVAYAAFLRSVMLLSFNFPFFLSSPVFLFFLCLTIFLSCFFNICLYLSLYLFIVIYVSITLDHRSKKSISTSHSQTQQSYCNCRKVKKNLSTSVMCFGSFESVMIQKFRIITIYNINGLSGSR